MLQSEGKLTIHSHYCQLIALDIIYLLDYCERLSNLKTKTHVLEVISELIGYSADSVTDPAFYVLLFIRVLVFDCKQRFLRLTRFIPFSSTISSLSHELEGTLEGEKRR